MHDPRGPKICVVDLCSLSRRNKNIYGLRVGIQTVFEILGFK